MPPAPLIIAKTSDREASVTCKPRSRCTTFAVATFRFGGVGPPKRGPTTVRSAATQREAPDRPSSLDRFSRNTKRDLDILDLAVVAFARRCDRVDSKAAFGFHEHDPILAFCRRARDITLPPISQHHFGLALEPVAEASTAGSVETEHVALAQRVVRVTSG